MRFVIVTGMSGGGKSHAIRMLEDAGFYCVDNLPVSLIRTFIDLLALPDNEITKVALGLDVRADQNFEEAKKVMASLREDGYPYEVLFMDASDATLVKRYKETRRVHPLTRGDRLEDGIARERAILDPVKQKADYVIDTSNLLTRDLKAEIDRIFIEGESYNSLMVTILSFGFKHGIPSDADLVFDVRFLPNPFYVEGLKHLTGNDKEVQDFVLSFDECDQFLNMLYDMLLFLIPNYIKEGTYQLVVAIGCTGGKHRSVTIANEIYRWLKEHGGAYGLKLFHREIKET